MLRKQWKEDAVWIAKKQYIEQEEAEKQKAKEEKQKAKKVHKAMEEVAALQGFSMEGPPVVA